MARTVRSRRLGKQRFFRFCPCLLNSVRCICSSGLTGLAELGQQICDTSLEQGACFPCTGRGVDCM